MFIRARSGSEGVIKDAKVTVTRSGNNVRLARQDVRYRAAADHRKPVVFEGNVNRWQTIDFHGAIIFRIPYRRDRAGHEPPLPGIDQPRSNARILDRHSMHSVTPGNRNDDELFRRLCL